MLDEKQKLKQYFEEEIQRVSGKEIEKIESEIDTIRQKSCLHACGDFLPRLDSD